MTQVADEDLERWAVVATPPPASSGAARQVMIGNRRRDSEPELALRRALHAAGLRYRVDFPIRAAGARPIRPDVVFTRARLAVFLDGCFWHGCRAHGKLPRTNGRYWSAKIATNQARDERQQRTLEQAGWAVLRVWEHDPPDLAAGRVAATLARLRGY
jgi:DNA mismatch endonuclease (patch repair protein)